MEDPINTYNRIVTFNVNSIRGFLDKETRSLRPFLDSFGATIICVQEHKLPATFSSSNNSNNESLRDVKCGSLQSQYMVQRATPGGITRELGIVPGYDAYYSFSRLSRQRAAYSGVATFVKRVVDINNTSEIETKDAVAKNECVSGAVLHGLAVRDAEEGFSGILAARDTEEQEMHRSSALKRSRLSKSEIAELICEYPEVTIEELESEGRCLILDHGQFVLLNVYFPAESGPERSAFKLAFSKGVEMRCAKLIAMKCNVILLGDVNVCSRSIDHCDPLQSMKEHGIAQFGDTAPRRWFSGLLQEYFTDTFRHSHPHREKAYTCWNTLLDARRGNFGTRLDYILVSHSMDVKIVNADILPLVMGSDHCPAFLDLGAEKTANINSSSARDNRRDLSVCTSTFKFLDEHPKLTGFFAKHKEKNAAGVQTKNSIKVTKARTSAPKKAQQQRKLRSFFSSSSPKLDCNDDKVRETDSKTDCTNNDLFEIAKVPIAPQNFNVKDDDDDVKLKPTAFAQLFQQMPPPLCKAHGEPCKEFTVNKSGRTHGKKFYVCSRPVGPSNEGDKWRCDTFIWKDAHRRKSLKQ